MNSKVLNVLILLLATNFRCANSGIVSIVKSSASTITEWYDNYIKPIWATCTDDSCVSADANISFYELEDINYSPSIQDENLDENIVLMDSDWDQIDNNLFEDSNIYTYLSNYDENFYNQMHESNKVNDSNNLGILQKFLKFIGYYRSRAMDDQIILRPHMISNQTDGLDVRLKFLFERYSENELVESGVKRLQLILPGTLWCGDGNAAISDQDLGLFYETDQCCRLHDFCPKYIEAGQQFMGLENVGIFTRSLCECDYEFYKCLKEVDSIISNRLGQTYFNVLRPQCFSNEYPIVGCIKRRRDDRCYNYVIDDSASKKTWQWFDSKKY